jgi:hypothetical protein
MWLFGKPDRDNNYNVKGKEYVIDLIICAFNNIFSVNKTKNNAVLPLKIILNLYLEHEILI